MSEGPPKPSARSWYDPRAVTRSVRRAARPAGPRRLTSAPSSLRVEPGAAPAGGAPTRGLGSRPPASPGSSRRSRGVGGASRVADPPARHPWPREEPGPRPAPPPLAADRYDWGLADPDAPACPAARRCSVDGEPCWRPPRPTERLPTTVPQPLHSPTKPRNRCLADAGAAYASVVGGPAPEPTPRARPDPRPPRSHLAAVRAPAHGPANRHGLRRPASRVPAATAAEASGRHPDPCAGNTHRPRRPSLEAQPRESRAVASVRTRVVPDNGAPRAPARPASRAVAVSTGPEAVGPVLGHQALPAPLRRATCSGAARPAAASTDPGSQP